MRAGTKLRGEVEGARGQRTRENGMLIVICFLFFFCKDGNEREKRKFTREGETDRTKKTKRKKACFRAKKKD